MTTTDGKSTMARLRGLGGRPFQRGFTLVELMIAVVLVGILTALIYAMFARTSDALMEVEERSDALDQARFGLDHVRNGLESAGAQATPNLEADPWAIDNQGLTVQGVMGYSGWQNQSTSQLGNANELNELETSNPQSEFSGVVVMGAYDMPANFYASFPAVQAGQADVDLASDLMIMEATERGTARLLGYDPFDLSVISGVDQQEHLGLAPGDEQDLESELQTRLFRVTDTEGIAQFAPLTGTPNLTDGNRGAGGSTDPAAQFDGLEMEIPLTTDDLVWSDEHDEAVGFDPGVAADVSFDAALIDAYWYYVRPAADDPKNLQLVRQRLDANDLAQNAGNLGADDPSQFVDETDPVRHPTMIIAENVVDFRIWFDCASGSPARLQNEQWHGQWDVGQADAGNCIQANPMMSSPQHAHFANVRLSTRTERENANRPHLTIHGGWDGFEEPNGQMQTYEIHPHSEGAATVVTVQAGVELSNIAMSGM